MVKVFAKKRCWVCKVPVDINIRVTPREYELIHEFSCVNPLDVTQNRVIYKVYDRVARPMCRVCYRQCKQPVHAYVQNRELGIKVRRYCTTRMPVTTHEMNDWVNGFKRYVRESGAHAMDDLDEMFMFPVTVPCIAGARMEISYYT